MEMWSPPNAPLHVVWWLFKPICVNAFVSYLPTSLVFSALSGVLIVHVVFRYAAGGFCLWETPLFVVFKIVRNVIAQPQNSSCLFSTNSEVNGSFWPNSTLRQPPPSPLSGLVLLLFSLPNKSHILLPTTLPSCWERGRLIQEWDKLQLPPALAGSKKIVG